MEASCAKYCNLCNARRRRSQIFSEVIDEKFLNEASQKLDNFIESQFELFSNEIFDDEQNWLWADFLHENKLHEIKSDLLIFSAELFFRRFFEPRVSTGIRYK